MQPNMVERMQSKKSGGVVPVLSKGKVGPIKGEKSQEKTCALRGREYGGYTKSHEQSRLSIFGVKQSKRGRNQDFMKDTKRIARRPKEKLKSQ